MGTNRGAAHATTRAPPRKAKVRPTFKGSSNRGSVAAAAAAAHTTPPRGGFPGEEGMFHHAGVKGIAIRTHGIGSERGTLPGLDPNQIYVGATRKPAAGGEEEQKQDREREFHGIRTFRRGGSRGAGEAPGRCARRESPRAQNVRGHHGREDRSSAWWAQPPV